MRIRKLLLIVFVCSISASSQVRGIKRVVNPMIVLDLGQGKIGAVSYNSSAPISSRIEIK